MTELQLKVIEAVKAVLNDQEAERKKYPAPTWPVNSIQDAIEAYSQEDLDFGNRFALQLLLMQLGIVEAQAREIVGLEAVTE